MTASFWVGLLFGGLVGFPAGVVYLAWRFTKRPPQEHTVYTRFVPPNNRELEHWSQSQWDEP